MNGWMDGWMDFGWMVKYNISKFKTEVSGQAKA